MELQGPKEPWFVADSGEDEQGRRMELVAAPGVTAAWIAEVLYNGKKNDEAVWIVTRRRVDVGWELEWRYGEDGERVWVKVWDSEPYVDYVTRSILG